MRINLQNTIAIVIDFQEKLVPAIENHDEILSRSTILLKGLSQLQVPMIVTRQYPKGLGDTVSSIKEVTKSVPIYDKITFSCYKDEVIRTVLHESNKKNIIICGIEAHICVMQTLIDLQDAEFQTIFVEDCIGSRKSNDKDIAIKRAVSEGAIVTTSEGILFELLERAGTETFKNISKLVK